MRSAQLLDLFRTQWLKLGVDAVVINLSNNDSNLSEFERNLDEMIQLSLANQIQVVLVLEPNSFERDEAGIVAKHAVVRSLATRYGVAQVDMHDYLKNRYDDGFLWWDSVHLTSFWSKALRQGT